MQDTHRNAKNVRYTLLLSAVMVLMLYLLLGIYPFGDGTVLTGDLNGQYISYFAHFRRALLSGEGFAYGFDKALGGGLLGIFAYYASSPFNLLYLFFEPAAYCDVAALLLALKLVAAGGCMTFFLDRHRGGCGRWSIPLGLGYSFMAYAVIYAQNIMWHDVVLLLPLVCHGIDRILSRRSPLVFTLTLAAGIWANFYIAYMVCLFSVFYFGYEMLLERKEKGTRAAFWKSRCLGFASGALTAGLLNGILLLPALENIQATKGELLEYSFSWQQTFSLARLPAQLLPGGFVWQDVVDGLPNLYCGLLAVICAIGYFCSKKISGREKLLSGAFLGGLVFTMWIRGLDNLWHGLKQPVWFPYRESFLLSFLILFLAAGALRRASFSPPKAVLFLGLNAALLFLALLFRSPAMGGRRAPLAALLWCMVIGLVAAALWGPHRLQKIAFWGCVLVTAGELTLNAYWSADQFEKYSRSDYRTFVERGTAVVDTLGAEAGSNFRMEKNFFRSLNDPMLLGYHGTAHFGSTQDVANTQMLNSLGYRSYGGSNSYGCGSTAFADAFLGIRYLLSDGAFPVGSHYEDMGEKEGWEIEQNPYAFPIGILLEKLDPIEAEEGSGSSTFEFQNRLYALLSGEKDSLFTPVETLSAFCGGEPASVTGAFEEEMEYRFTAPDDGIYYAVMTSGSGLPLSLSVDGKIVESGYFTAEQSGVIDLGRREAGESCTFAVAPRQESASVEEITIYRMDENSLRALSERLNRENEGLTLKEGTAHGIVEAEQDGWFLMQIPYEEALVISVDGEETQAVKAGGSCVAIALNAGKHELDVAYRAPGVTAGAVLFFAGVAGLLGLIVWTIKIDKKEQREG